MKNLAGKMVARRSNCLQRHRLEAQAILFCAFDLMVSRGKSLLGCRLKSGGIASSTSLHSRGYSEPEVSLQ
jgi:hypothetical protein